MKRILSVLMLVLAVALFANCGGEETTEPTGPSIKAPKTPEQMKMEAMEAEKSKLDKMLEEANQYKKLADKYNAAGNSTKAARFQKLYNTAKSNYDTAKAAYDKAYPAK